MKFYLGMSQPAWLRRSFAKDVPMMISQRSFANRKTYPRAIGSWVLDSGGFTELALYGEWRTTLDEYVDAVRTLHREVGSMDWCAPQDWMCEPSMLEKTGKTVREHQVLTVRNYLELRQELGDLVIPVLQGWERDDYLRCIDLYEDNGVELDKLPTVGVGSVCRRHAEDDISGVFAAIGGTNYHAFGVKSKGAKRNEKHLVSCDSFAWAVAARYEDPLPECTAHWKCTQCWKFALQWYNKQLTY